jgi:hypothetical protein
VPLTVLLAESRGLMAPPHKLWLAGTVIIGVGCTVTEKFWEVPGHPLAVGVTVTVAVNAVLPLLVALKEPILPVPLPARPMEVLLFSQLYVTPLTVLLKLIAPCTALLHTDWLAILFTVGLGFTVNVKVCAGPLQPLATGITYTVATTGLLPLLTAVNEPTLPLPLLAMPIEVPRVDQL